MLLWYNNSMTFKKICNQLNIYAQCRRYGLSLWQCPQFLFLIMGLIIIVAIFTAYAIGTQYVGDPELVALIILFITAILFVIAVVITQSFERLAEVSRMKSEFINIVTHQLRSPLTNLKWAIDFLISGDINEVKEKEVDYFKILKENAFRMGELIDNLLIVSRIEQGNFPLKKEAVSLEDLVKELIKDFQPFAIASNVEIEFQAEKDLPKIFIDPSQIKLLIDNLISNAIRYTRGRGKVVIHLLKEEKNLYFEVEDNGVGIPKDDQKYIFQKFFRATNALRYQTQGSGLGLYIAKCVAESSGGKIGFKSEEGKGSTFWFTIPIK